MSKYNQLKELLREEAEAGAYPKNSALTESIMREVRHIRNARLHQPTATAQSQLPRNKRPPKT